MLLLYMTLRHSNNSIELHIFSEKFYKLWGHGVYVVSFKFPGSA